MPARQGAFILGVVFEAARSVGIIPLDENAPPPPTPALGLEMGRSSFIPNRHSALAFLAPTVP